VSQASCSFHLRQLAKYGFVEEAAAGPDRRERVWQLTDVEQSWRSGPATDQLDRVFAQREADRVLGWTARRAAEPAHWQDAAFLAARACRSPPTSCWRSGSSCGPCSSRTWPA
jgi:hypothetical protein